MKFTCIVLTKSKPCFFNGKITIADKKYCFKHLRYHHSREELINTVKHFNLLENPYSEDTNILANAILDFQTIEVVNQ